MEEDRLSQSAMRSGPPDLPQRHPFRRIADLLTALRLRWSSGTPYWTLRARLFGQRAVLNLGHRPEEFDAVTRRQKAELLPRLAALLDGSERTILDLGCGPGRFTPALADTIRGRAIGIDVVASLLDAAPRAPHVEYRLMRAGVIPLEDRSVDALWVCLVLGGLDEALLNRTSREMLRVLRPGGLLFMAENTAEKPGDRHWKFRTAETYRREFFGIHLTTVHEYEDLGERITVMAGRGSAA